MTRQETITIEAYIDRALCDLRKDMNARFDGHDKYHEALAEHVELARQGIEFRLQSMNKFREQTIEDRALYMPRVEYELKHETLMNMAGAEATQKAGAVLAEHVKLEARVTALGQQLAPALATATASQARFQGLVPIIGIIATLITMFLLIAHVVGLY